MRIRALLGCAIAGGMLVAACGDDGGSGEYSEAVAEAIRSEENIPFSDDEIDCLADEMVDAVGGPSAFEDAGIEPDEVEETSDLTDAGLDIGEDEAREVAGSFGACDISLTDSFLDTLGPEVPDEVRDCIEDSIDDAAFADIFVQVLVSGQDAEDALGGEVMGDLMACMGGAGG